MQPQGGNFAVADAEEFREPHRPAGHLGIVEYRRSVQAVDFLNDS